MQKREIKLKEMQDIEFGILYFLKQICDKFELRYYLAYGTLLGAVRHQGFIPWDDDVDVIMPRKDYYRLVNIMKEQETGYYKLVSFDTHPEFTAPLPKIIDTRTELIQHYDFIEKVPLGVYIDIFVMDGVADDYQEALQNYKNAYKRFIKWVRADSLLFPANRTKLYGLLRWVRNFPYKVHGMRHYMRKQRENNGQCSFYGSRYVACLDFMLGSPEQSVYEQTWFGNGTNLMFNGVEFRVPTDYGKVLHNYYGEYMTLPPEEERVTHHNYTVTWK